MDDMLTESAETVLAQLCTPGFVRQVEQAGTYEVGRELWQQLQELGFLDALVPEAQGGIGLNLAAMSGSLLAFGRHALPLPAGQTMLARRLLAQAGIEAPHGPIALTVADSEGVAQIPDGRLAEAVLVQTGAAARLVAIADIQVEARTHSLDVQARIPAQVGQPLALPQDEIIGSAALVTATLMAGAMQRVLDITLQYVGERQQFGRPVAKFQAVQQQLSVMAEQVAATRTAAQIGCAAYATVSQLFGLAVAKARASRAAPLVANTAHGLIAAMGITAEFDLQLYTRRLHVQRRHYGAESYWDALLGSHAIADWESMASGVTALFETLEPALASA